jgi:hypothetical protein
MKSSWEYTKSKSNYHFNSLHKDHKSEVITTLGNVEPTWLEDLPAIIEQARPATWATRGYKGEGIPPPREDLAAEEYDLVQAGVDPDMTITHLNWTMPTSLKKLSKQFALEDCMERIHVQRPGEVWNLHIDKLNKWCPEDPSKVMRVFIQLTDWQQGQFWEFGNYHWRRWTAGDIVTFDWANMPHSTANAGHNPRVTLQLTGIITKQTKKFLSKLK